MSSLLPGEVSHLFISIGSQSVAGWGDAEVFIHVKEESNPDSFVSAGPVKSNMPRTILPLFHTRFDTTVTVGCNIREGRDVKKTDVGIAEADASCLTDMPRNSIIKIQHLSCWRNRTLLSRLRVILSIQLQYCVCVCVCLVWCGVLIQNFTHLKSILFPDISILPQYRPPTMM